MDFKGTIEDPYVKNSLTNISTLPADELRLLLRKFKVSEETLEILES